jgi:hypothetical protein
MILSRAARPLLANRRGAFADEAHARHQILDRF